MITPIQARFDAFTYLEEKYSELLEKVDKIIRDAVEEGNLQAPVCLDSLSDDDRWKFKKLLEHKGYVVRPSARDNTILIDW